MMLTGLPTWSRMRWRQATSAHEIRAESDALPPLVANSLTTKLGASWIDRAAPLVSYSGSPELFGS